MVLLIDQIDIHTILFTETCIFLKLVRPIIMSSTDLSDTSPSVGLLLGRFQPFHLGHLHALKYALSKVDQLLLGIGSSNKSRETDNPYNAQERYDMITQSVSDAMLGRITIHMVPDVDNHKEWVRMLYKTLPPFNTIFTNDSLTTKLMANTSVYGIPFLNRTDLSGTVIRTRMATNMPWQHLVPGGTARVVRSLGFET